MKQLLRLIINKWNPIEIHPLIEAEYDYEIDRILLKFNNKNLSIEEKGDIIYQIFKDSFSEIFVYSVAECTIIAKEYTDSVHLEKLLKK